MARIDWAILCESAFLDRQNRLCIISVIRKLPTESLPVTLRQIMLIGRLVDLKPVEELAIAAGVVTSSGIHLARPDSDQTAIEMASEYILVTFRDLPLIEEGVHRFQLMLRGQPVVSVEVPVLTNHHTSSIRVQ